ncbi:MAG: hypothetical protein WBI14_07265 [Anaerolineaceae bacterium]
MSTTDEKMRILKMLEVGKIDASQAAELLKAVDTHESASQTVDQMDTYSGAVKKGKWLVVKVTDTQSGKKKVNVRVPMTLVRGASKIAGKTGKFNLNGVEIENLEELLNSGMEGMIADVTDETENEHVEVFIE